MIYPIPVVYNGERCKIAINEKGVEKIGKDVYEKTPTKKKVEIMTDSGKKEGFIMLPALHEKIDELYAQIYTKHHEKRDNEIPIDTSAAG